MVSRQPVKWNQLKTHFIFVYKGTRAIPVCAHCKGLNYDQTAHKCPVITANPTLVPRDLTVNDELLDHDDYGRYWRNWEAAVNYQEKLVKRYEPTQSEKDHEEPEMDQVEVKEETHVIENESPTQVEIKAKSEESEEKRHNLEMVKQELETKLFTNQDAYCTECYAKDAEVKALEEQNGKLRNENATLKQFNGELRKVGNEWQQKSYDIDKQLIDSARKVLGMSDTMGLYMQEINALKTENKVFKDKFAVVPTQELQQLQDVLVAGGLREQIRQVVEDQLTLFFKSQHKDVPKKQPTASFKPQPQRMSEIAAKYAPRSEANCPSRNDHTKGVDELIKQESGCLSLTKHVEG